jgi:CubicO group peptidase (beta-lactamase class C family)
VRDIKTGQPMTVDTRFVLFSMTKPITSFAAMMPVDDGKLSLDDPVAKYVPSFAERPVGVEEVGASGKSTPQPPFVIDHHIPDSGLASLQRDLAR